MKKAIVFGAGSIGRGFMGQILSQSDYEVVFIDINMDIINKLNQKRSYPINIISDTENREVIVRNVRAINFKNKDAVIKEIVSADIISTSAGVNALSEIA